MQKRLNVLLCKSVIVLSIVLAVLQKKEMLATVSTS